MWPTENRHGAREPAEVAERICSLGGSGERANEQQIRILHDLADEIFRAGVATEAHVVAEFLAPHADRLWHDARQARVHNSFEQATGRAFGDKARIVIRSFRMIDPVISGLAELIEPTGSDAIGAAFVFLDLLECQSYGLTPLFAGSYPTACAASVDECTRVHRSDGLP